MVTDADRLAAAGAALSIANHDFHVRYTPRSLKLLEDRYGSITKVGVVLANMQSGDEPMISTVFFILACGLRHEEDALGQPITEDWLLDNGDSHALNEYAEQAFAALLESLPGQKPADPTQARKRAKPSPSNGQATSGSASGTSISVLQSSGTG